LIGREELEKPGFVQARGAVSAAAVIAPLSKTMSLEVIDNSLQVPPAVASRGVGC
jgi:hypothetical protein